MVENHLIKQEDTHYSVTLKGIWISKHENGKKILNACEDLIPKLKDIYKNFPENDWVVDELAQKISYDVETLSHCLYFMKDLPFWSGMSPDAKTANVKTVKMSEGILDLVTLDKYFSKFSSDEYS
jgi:hypothetical protein